MARTLHLILLLAFILVFDIQAQAQFMSGIIFDDVDETPVEAAIVLNKTTGTSLLSNERGAYRLQARFGDSILVKLMGYEDVNFIVREAGKQEFVRNIYLKPIYGQLKEVVVSTLTPYQRDSVARRNLYGNTLSREGEWVSGAAAVFSPATALAQLVSKKAKQRKRFIENFEKWEEDKYIQSRYTPELVISVVPLNADSLAKFMIKYPIAGDFARAATEVELKMWIRYNYLDWTEKFKANNTDSLNKKR